MRALNLAVLLVALTAAKAQAGKGQWSLSLTPGVAAPVGEGRFKSEHGTSLHLLTAVNYEVEDGYWYGLELGYSAGHKFHGKMAEADFDGDGRKDSVSFSSDIDETMMNVTPTIRAGGLIADEVKYSFTLGMGLYAFWTGSGHAALSGTGSTGASLNGARVPFAGSSNAYGGLSLGHTLGYEIRDFFELALDLRYHLIFRPHGGVGLAVPGLRFGWLF